MDNTQRVIVVLLVLAIVFSVVSIAINVGLVGIDLPNVSAESRETDQGVTNGQISFILEDNNAPE